MMRTIEVLLVAIILFAAFTITSFYAVLPSPRSVSGSSLRELSLSTMEMLDANGDLSRTVFNNLSDPSWASLEVALASSLPPNIVYNLTVYNIITSSSGVVTYSPVRSLSNSKSDLGTGSDASSYIVESSNVKFTATPQKIGQSSGKNITLYLLNCNDANGWWITGYTGQSLASDLYNLLSPYFQKTVLVNSTYQLGQLLNGIPIATGAGLQDAVVINTFGECVPIPTSFCTTPYSNNGYAYYAYTLGQKVYSYNWTWVSIVGYPFYYVSNTGFFTGPNDQNTYGIFGMKCVASGGLNAFLQGLDNEGYSYNSQWITAEIGTVQFTWNASYYSNYYGIYPSPTQTASRALPTSILGTGGYNLYVKPNGYIFQVKSYQGNNYIAGATYNHKGSDNKIHGSLTAIGLTRIPDIRITALGLLQFYLPTIYKSQFGASGTSRLVVLQLAQQGGA